MESEREFAGSPASPEKETVTLWGRRAGTMGLADLLIPLLVLGVAGDPLTIYTPSSSSAVLGSAALLKCRFNIGGPINLTTLQVHWYFSDQIMAQYDRGKEIFAPGVSISEQELRIGNASLGMENVQVSDEGQYKCVVVYGAEQQQSETTLRVFAAPRLSIPWRSARTDTASSFPCHVWGFYPQDVTVTWLRDGRVLTDATHSAPQRNPDGTFNLTLTYTFTPTARDSGSTVSCRVTHAALAQPLREEFPLAVTGPSSAVETPPEDPAGSSDKTRGEDTVLMGTDGASDAGEGSEQQPLLPAQGREQSETQEQDGAQGTGRGAPYSVSEVLGPARSLVGQEVTVILSMGGTTPPEAPAESSDKTRREDTVLMGTDGVSDAGEGSEQQPLLPAQDWEQSETQEQDGAQGTGSNSSGSEASDVGTGVSSCITQGAPEAEGPSPNTEPLGEPGARDEERVGAASPQAQPAAEVAFPAQPSAAGEEGETELSQHSWEAMLPSSQPSTGDQGAPGSQPSTGDQGAPGSLAEAAANTVSDPAQEEDAQGEAGDPPQAPVLGEISQPQVLAPGEQVTLSCQISGFYPKELSVTWYRRGRGESEFRCLDKPDTHKIDTPDPTAAPDRKSYSVTSQLRLTPVVPEDDGAEYRCSVEHQTLQKPEGKSTGPLELRAQPQVSGIQVLPHWEPRDQVPFAVQIQNFYPRGIHLIEWSWDGAQRWRDETPEINQNPDLTFSATSVCRIPSRELNRPELRVRVFVQQSPRELPTVKEIRARDTGLLRPPKVSEISQPESVTAGEEITLSCRMKGHFPGALSVAWLRRGIGARAAVPLQGSAEYRIEDGAPDTQDGKSFQQETRLSFTHSVQRDQWAEYVCQVGHVALGTALERRSRELQVTARADSAPTKPSASENRSRDAESASSLGEAPVTGPLVEEGAGDTAPKGNTGGDGGAETKSENDTHKGTTTTQNDTARATPAREQARDGAAGPTPAKGGTTSDASAKERVGDNTANEDTTSDTSAREQARDGAASLTPAKGGATSDASAKERAGDNAADEDTTSELAEGGTGGARPAIGVVGDRVASTTPVTKVLPDAVVSAQPAGGPAPDAEASATRGGDDADRAERVEEFGADGTAGAFPGSSEQTA